MNVWTHWAFLLSLTLTITLISFFLWQRLASRLIPQLEKTKMTWDSGLLIALTLPMQAMICLIGISIGLPIISRALNIDWLDTLFRLFRNFAFLVIALWFCFRFILHMEREYSNSREKRKKKRDKTTVRAICQIARIFTLLIALLIYLQAHQVNISALLAFGGAGGIVVGLAAKDLLANFFGGLIIYMDRPFSVGDWIRSPDKEIEGYVEHIGWRLTHLRTLAKRPLYVPNGMFSTISIENPSRMSHRQIKARFSLRYCDASKMETIVNKVRNMVKENPSIDQNKLISVYFDEVALSSLNFLVYCFSHQTQHVLFKQCQQEIFLNTLHIIKEEGAECAFPTTTLNLPKDAL
ncbi:MAG: mechanosensitive ion channel family protein [Chlamydiota bacterium]|nr:mechanosensitive ion channel family protein [Chlamydiota bacterium]